MPRDSFSRDGLRARNSARLPGNTGRNAYTRGRTAVGPSQEDPAAEGDNERNVEEAEAAVLKEYEIIDLTEDVLSQQIQPDSQGRYRYKQAAGNESLESSHRAISVYKFGDMDLKPDTCVELREPFGKWEVRDILERLLVKYNADHSRIDSICRDPVDSSLQN